MPLHALTGDPFDALGDPNRRAIVELLRTGDRSVSELADALPISRPAVSRHLRLLKQAGLVADRAEGTRRLYRLDDEGIAAVRAYLEHVWGKPRPGAGSSPRTQANGQDGTPLDRADRADRDRVRGRLLARARLRHLGEQDLAVVARSHSMSSAPGLVVTFESRAGGRIYERTPDGTEHDWGEVLAWEPPRRLAYLWHLGTDHGRATEVDISFAGGAGASATSAAGAASSPTTGRRWVPRSGWPGSRWRRPAGRRSPARPGSAGGAGRSRCRWCRG
jgi:DNA-binding transcriptional ArsR family regulator